MKGLIVMLTFYFQISTYETLELGNDTGLCYSFIHLAWERFYLDRKDILSSCPKTWEKSSRSGTKLSETFKFLWKNEIHVSNSTHAEEDARPTKLSSKALCNAQPVKNQTFVQKIQNMNIVQLFTIGGHLFPGVCTTICSLDICSLIICFLYM